MEDTEYTVLELLEKLKNDDSWEEDEAVRNKVSKNLYTVLSYSDM